MRFACRAFRLAVVVTSLAVALATAKVDADETRHSEKKGFCTVVRDDGAWLKKVNALNARWFYCWGATRPEQTPPEIEFTPMIWGRPGKKTQEKLERIKAAGERGQIRYLLGFNEPDENSQSNMSVKEALNLWPKLMQPNLPLGSPSCVHPDRQWMKEFMAGVKERELRVDFICVHSYGPPNAQALISRLRQVHKLFERPIWITELAVGDWNARDVAENKHRPETIARFMRELLPRLERLDFVHRYAWFSAKPDNKALGTSALFNEDGSLTDLGRIYSRF